MSCSRWTYTHISKEIAGDLRPSYIPLSHTNTHTKSHVIHRSLCSKPTPVHNKTHKDTHTRTESNDILI